MRVVNSEQGLKAAGRYVSGKHCFPSMSLSYLAWTYFILGLSSKAGFHRKTGNRERPA